MLVPVLYAILDPEHELLKYAELIPRGWRIRRGSVGEQTVEEGSLYSLLPEELWFWEIQLVFQLEELAAKANDACSLVGRSIGCHDVQHQTVVYEK